VRQLGPDLDERISQVTQAISIETLRSIIATDKEWAYKIRGLDATVRIGPDGSACDIVIAGGAVNDVRPAEGVADVVISAPDAFWEIAFARPLAEPAYNSLSRAFSRGVKVQGDFSSLVAAYQGAWQRLYLLTRKAACGLPERRPDPEPFRETDTAIGRYAYVRANGEEARIYYETAGSGPVPLLLQPTAGADGRQYRYLLADPEMQKRFTMYAYDLPYHGKSLPPLGVRWWEQPYKPTRDYLMNWVVGLADHLGLEQPFFMGCSVGGQLALDLAAYHGDRFGAFISINGWYDSPIPADAINNEIFRTPSVSEDHPMSIILGATAPLAPEATAQEVYWVYRSNFPGVYAGDNDYFLHEHDLKQCGDRIDAVAKPLIVIAGQYDPAADDTVHGGPAIERHIKGSEFIVAEGLGHFAPSDDPIGFSAMLLPILDRAILRVRGPRR
jgi:pimeloyl-ACP methyl ester carboxylesterase